MTNNFCEFVLRTKKYLRNLNHPALKFLSKKLLALARMKHCGHVGHTLLAPYAKQKPRHINSTTGKKDKVDGLKQILTAILRVI